MDGDAAAAAVGRRDSRLGNSSHREHAPSHRYRHTATCRLHGFQPAMVAQIAVLLCCTWRRAELRVGAAVAADESSDEARPEME